MSIAARWSLRELGGATRSAESRAHALATRPIAGGLGSELARNSALQARGFFVRHEVGATIRCALSLLRDLHGEVPMSPSLAGRVR